MNKSLKYEVKVMFKIPKMLFSTLTSRNRFPTPYNDDAVIKTTSSWLRRSKERTKRK